MFRRDRWFSALLGACCFSLLATTTTSQAGFGDALKKKLAEHMKVQEKPAADSTASPGDTGTKQAAQPASSDTTTKVSAVSTKFDFVPGDKVLLIDDFTQDEVGEFPVKWRPTVGNFEVVESASERWLRCVSTDGTVRMKLPAMVTLPEYWTLEFDFECSEPMGSALTVSALSKGDQAIWEAIFPQGMDLAFSSGSYQSRTPYEGASSPAGRHHVMFMARGKGIKAYMDRQRMASLPEVEDGSGPAVMLEIRLWATTKPMITNVRFAEGCKPAQDMLATGKLVTYGIHFATGSDVVLADSAPILRQVAAWLQANPAAKLSITGHTDNVGAAAGNLDLSKRRAASVARVLSEQFAIAADRFTTQGKGDTQALSDNGKAEGRAMNRRVEFAKL